MLYPKINSVYNRGPKGEFLLGEWAEPEFEYLSDLPWNWTEKIDGTNIRIGLEGYREPFYGGRTENAAIPTKLLTWLQENARWEQDYLNEVFRVGKDEAGLLLPFPKVYLFGEGYGAGIQKGGGNYSPDQRFILFDINIDGWWLERKNVIDIADKLGLHVVPVMTHISLNKMIETVRDTVTQGNSIPRSSIGTALVEGFVGTPEVSLFNRKGERIMTKIKFKDFRL